MRKQKYIVKGLAALLVILNSATSYAESEPRNRYFEKYHKPTQKKSKPKPALLGYAFFRGFFSLIDSVGRRSLDEGIFCRDSHRPAGSASQLVIETLLAGTGEFRVFPVGQQSVKSPANDLGHMATPNRQIRHLKVHLNASVSPSYPSSSGLQSS